MAKYTPLVTDIYAHQINADAEAASELWPVWLLGITATDSGTWVVETTNGFFEVMNDSFICINGVSDGTAPFEKSALSIAEQYSPAVAEEE